MVQDDFYDEIGQAKSYGNRSDEIRDGRGKVVIVEQKLTETSAGRLFSTIFKVLSSTAKTAICPTTGVTLPSVPPNEVGSTFSEDIFVDGSNGKSGKSRVRKLIHTILGCNEGDLSESEVSAATRDAIENNAFRGVALTFDTIRRAPRQANPKKPHGYVAPNWGHVVQTETEIQKLRADLDSGE